MILWPEIADLSQEVGGGIRTGHRMRITQRQSFLLVGAILCLFFGGTFFLVRGSRRLPPEPSATQTVAFVEPTIPSPTTPGAVPVSATPESGQQFVLQQFQRSETRDGKKVWEVKAERGSYDPTTNSATLTMAVLEMARKNRDAVVISSDRAQLFLSGTSLKSADLQGNVVLTHAKGTTLRAAQATYDREKNSIMVPGAVEIAGVMLDITGVGLTGNLEREEFHLSSNVETVIKPRKKSSP